MFFVHRSCRDLAGVARTVGAAISSKDKRDRSLQHKQPRVKLVRVRPAMHVWFNFALAKLIALAPKVGFELGSIHRHLPFSINYLGVTSVPVNVNVPSAVPPPSRGSPWSGKLVSVMVPATLVRSELNVKV